MRIDEVSAPKLFNDEAQREVSGYVVRRVDRPGGCVNPDNVADVSLSADDNCWAWHKLHVMPTDYSG